MAVHTLPSHESMHFLITLLQMRRIFKSNVTFTTLVFLHGIFTITLSGNDAIFVVYVFLFFRIPSNDHIIIFRLMVQNGIFAN